MKKRKFIFFLLKLFLFLSFKYFKPSKTFAKNKFNTLILFNKNFLNTIFSLNHPENPSRITEILKDLEKNNLNKLIKEISFPKNSIKLDYWIKKIHTSQHIDSLKKKYPVGEKMSRTAVHLCTKGVDKIMLGEVKNIFCLTRPPGHHALNTGKDEGFCFYNHIAITAKYIQEQYKLSKILIVDWDYHHGNSTEFFFYNDPSVLFFSTHDQFAYPGTGSPLRRGIDEGLGFNVNIHLPCGTEDQTIIETFENNLIQKAEDFKPDFILVSAGFDSRENDLLGCFRVTDRGFIELTKIIMNIAKKTCADRILSILEGGYNTKGNSQATIQHIKTLSNF